MKTNLEDEQTIEQFQVFPDAPCGIYQKSEILLTGLEPQNPKSNHAPTRL